MSYANATHAVETPPGSQVWKLTIQARATDAAGNLATLSSYYLFIDNDLDKPTVNIVSPTNGQNIGGSVLVTGTAFDDDAVHHVEMQIDLNGDGDFLDSIDLNGDFDFQGKFEQESLWYPVSGTTLWTQELNGSGELYQTQPGHTGDINLRARAVDTKDLVNPGIAGNFQQLAIHFDNTIPRIENLNLGSGDYVKGSFSLTGDALDDTQVTGIYISYDGGVNYTNITGDPTKVTQNSPNDYDLHLSINSASYVPDQRHPVPAPEGRGQRQLSEDRVPQPERGQRVPDGGLHGGGRRHLRQRDQCPPAGHRRRLRLGERGAGRGGLFHPRGRRPQPARWRDDRGGQHGLRGRLRLRALRG